MSPRNHGRIGPSSQRVAKIDRLYASLNHIKIHENYQYIQDVVCGHFRTRQLAYIYLLRFNTEEKEKRTKCQYILLNLSRVIAQEADMQTYRSAKYLKLPLYI